MALFDFLHTSCNQQIAERDALIKRYQEHDSAAYGLPDLKVAGLKLDESHIQRLWASYGVPMERQHNLSRSYYAPLYKDLRLFLQMATSHLGKSFLDYQCADYATGLMGEKLALGLFGAVNIEWYLAIIGMIQGQLRVKPCPSISDGKANHGWTWAICKDNPEMIVFIDYLEPLGPFDPVTNITKAYMLQPSVHQLVNCNVTW